MKTKKTSKSAKQEKCYYLIEVLDWEVSYFLSAGHDRDIVSRKFWEMFDLIITGKLTSPDKLFDKVLKVRIIGDRRLVHAINHPEDIGEPTGIGDLNIRGKHAECIIIVPADIVQTLIVLLSCHKLNYLELSGQPLKYGSANILSINCTRDAPDEEDES